MMTFEEYRTVVERKAATYKGEVHWFETPEAMLSIIFWPDQRYNGTWISRDSIPMVSPDSVNEGLRYLREHYESKTLGALFHQLEDWSNGRSSAPLKELIVLAKKELL
jgi:hypothetical protein